MAKSVYIANTAIAMALYITQYVPCASDEFQFQFNTDDGICSSINRQLCKIVSIELLHD